MNTQMQQAKSIQADLKRIGVKQKDIAQIVGVNPVCVSEVIYCKRKNPRIRKAISLALGKPVSELWPEDQKKRLSPDSRNESAVGDVGRASDPNRG